jgi:hypothetical protein
MKSQECQKCRSVRAGEAIKMVWAEAVEERPRVVDTGMYTARYVDRIYRFDSELHVFLCDSCLTSYRYRWCAAAILSFAIVILSHAVSSSDRIFPYESLGIDALHIVARFGGTFLLLLSLSWIAGFIGKGTGNELALRLLREHVNKRNASEAAEIVLFTKPDWEIIRKAGHAIVEPNDDFALALILLGAFVVPFVISYALNGVGHGYAGMM